MVVDNIAVSTDQPAEVVQQLIYKVIKSAHPEYLGQVSYRPEPSPATRAGRKQHSSSSGSSEGVEQYGLARFTMDVPLAAAVAVMISANEMSTAEAQQLLEGLTATVAQMLKQYTQEQQAQTQQTKLAEELEERKRQLMQQRELLQKQLASAAAGDKGKAAADLNAVELEGRQVEEQLQAVQQQLLCTNSQCETTQQQGQQLHAQVAALQEYLQQQLQRDAAAAAASAGHIMPLCGVLNSLQCWVEREDGSMAVELARPMVRLQTSHLEGEQRRSRTVLAALTRFQPSPWMQNIVAAAQNSPGVLLQATQAIITDACRTEADTVKAALVEVIELKLQPGLAEVELVMANAAAAREASALGQVSFVSPTGGEVMLTFGAQQPKETLQYAVQIPASSFSSLTSVELQSKVRNMGLFAENSLLEGVTQGLIDGGQQQQVSAPQCWGFTAEAGQVRLADCSAAEAEAMLLTSRGVPLGRIYEPLRKLLLPSKSGDRQPRQQQHQPQHKQQERFLLFNLGSALSQGSISLAAALGDFAGLGVSRLATSTLSSIGESPWLPAQPAAAGSDADMAMADKIAVALAAAEPRKPLSSLPNSTGPADEAFADVANAAWQQLHQLDPKTSIPQQLQQPPPLSPRARMLARVKQSKARRDRAAANLGGETVAEGEEAGPAQQRRRLDAPAPAQVAGFKARQALFQQHLAGTAPARASQVAGSNSSDATTAAAEALAAAAATVGVVPVPGTGTPTPPGGGVLPAAAATDTRLLTQLAGTGLGEDEEMVRTGCGASSWANTRMVETTLCTATWDAAHTMLTLPSTQSVITCVYKMPYHDCRPEYTYMHPAYAPTCPSPPARFTPKPGNPCTHMPPVCSWMPPCRLARAAAHPQPVRLHNGKLSRACHIPTLLEAPGGGGSAREHEMCGMQRGSTGWAVGRVVGRRGAVHSTLHLHNTEYPDTYLPFITYLVSGVTRSHDDEHRLSMRIDLWFARAQHCSDLPYQGIFTRTFA
jgi:hypothetical protein